MGWLAGFQRELCVCTAEPRLSKPGDSAPVEVRNVDAALHFEIVA